MSAQRNASTLTKVGGLCKRHELLKAQLRELVLPLPLPPPLLLLALLLPQLKLPSQAAAAAVARRLILLLCTLSLQQPIDHRLLVQAPGRGGAEQVRRMHPCAPWTEASN